MAKRLREEDIIPHVPEIILYDIPSEMLGEIWRALGEDDCTKRVLLATSRIWSEVSRRFGGASVPRPIAWAKYAAEHDSSIEFLSLLPNEKHWPYLCDALARFGRLDSLKWAKQNNFFWITGTCTKAAKGGHLNVLQWMREQGCNGDWETTYAAAKHGHVEVLKWTVENGCKLSVRCKWIAAVRGHLGVLQYIHSVAPFDTRLLDIGCRARGWEISLLT